MAYKPKIGDVVTYASTNHKFSYVVLEIEDSPYTHHIQVINTDHKYEVYASDVLRGCKFAYRMSRLESVIYGVDNENT